MNSLRAKILIDQLFETDVNSDIQQKLEETKKAFDETESKVNQ